MLPDNVCTAAEGRDRGPWPAAVFCVSAMVIFTGGLHEDGLGDFDDDLGGGNPARRLAIMHDSRAGNFAILSLVL